MKLLIVGYGKMGQPVAELAPSHGCEVSGVIDVDKGDWSVPADVAVAARRIRLGGRTRAVVTDVLGAVARAFWRLCGLRFFFRGFRVEPEALPDLLHEEPVEVALAHGVELRPRDDRRTVARDPDPAGDLRRGRPVVARHHDYADPRGVAASDRLRHLRPGRVEQRDETEERVTRNRLAADRARLAEIVEEQTRELSQANADLSRSARLKDEFLASMSHELRTPVNAVLGIGEALSDGVFGPIVDRQREALRDLVDSGQHLLGLINDILDLSKIEAGRIEMHYETFDVRQLIDDVASIAKPLAAKNSNQLSFHVDGDAGAMRSDLTRVQIGRAHV